MQVKCFPFNGIEEHCILFKGIKTQLLLSPHSKFVASVTPASREGRDRSTRQIYLLLDRKKEENHQSVESRTRVRPRDRTGTEERILFLKKFRIPEVRIGSSSRFLSNGLTCKITFNRAERFTTLNSAVRQAHLLMTFSSSRCRRPFHFFLLK